MSALRPSIIQGGMGVAVSHYRLANAVARCGGLGVVSGTGLDQVLARRLQMGDPSGDLRRAIAAFPCQETATTVLDQYFIEGGKDPEDRFRTPSMFTISPSLVLQRLTALSAFVEVWLAKEGHDGLVGLNLLEKIPLPNPAMLYGAMVAGVDYVLMGAGIPWQIPGTLDRFAENEAAEMNLALEDDPERVGAKIGFDPKLVFGTPLPVVKRPEFLAVVSSDTLAGALLKRANGQINGFVVETPIAGGHNAPPRGRMQKNDRGEPIYGDRDTAKLEKFKELGLPFWLAGGWGFPGSVRQAEDLGAQGVQVGTAFAFCLESGLEPTLRHQVLQKVASHEINVYTDPDASPTGFPFKVVELEGTLSDEKVYRERSRICDAGYLRRAFLQPDGTVGYRCPSATLASFSKSGGNIEETEGRKCLCNALLANVGLPQVRHGSPEMPLLTAGNDLVNLLDYFPNNLYSYTAKDVMHLLSE